MFQAIGAPSGAQPQAPPDNVLILPIEKWHELFDPQASVRPDSVRLQIHAELDRANLPSDPQAAFQVVTAEGHNFEARAAGGALLSSDLSTILGAAREDALYARVLFLFLGAPGAAVAALLTLAIVRSEASRRRRDQSLLRLRGASAEMLLKIAAAEALAIGIAGSLIGAVLGAVVSWFLLSVPLFTSGQLIWVVAGVLTGIGLSLAAVLAPAWLDLRHLSIVSGRASLGDERSPLWMRGYVDVLLLAIAAIVFWQTAVSGYQIVLAPEGVAAVSVDYWAFLAPLFFWLGMGLLALRIDSARAWAFSKCRDCNDTAHVGAACDPGRRWTRPAAKTDRHRGRADRACSRLRNIDGHLQRHLSSAIASRCGAYEWLRRYRHRNHILTVGTAPRSAGRRSGVTAAVPIQHRFAYVGADLQDLYGIDPATIASAATLSNAFFGNDDSRASLLSLQSTADGVLVSDETVTDFQLEPGDAINLRLQNAADHQYHVVPFHFVGVVREFPRRRQEIHSSSRTPPMWPR